MFLNQRFLTSVLESQLSKFCMFSLFNALDPGYQFISRELSELDGVCQKTETYKMCRAVGPQEQS